jgi:hypothetical protein
MDDNTDYVKQHRHFKHQLRRQHHRHRHLEQRYDE